MPGGEPRVGAREETGGARVVVDAQARRARANPCAVVASAPRRSALARRRRARGDRFIRTERRGGAVPRAPFDVARAFEGRCERGMHLALLVRGERVVHDRTQQRVAQDDAAPFDRHEAFVLGCLERIELEPEQRERVDRLRQARDAVGRDHAHREPGRGRQSVEPVAERLADPRPDRERLHAFGHRHGADELGQLEQRERVARRDLQQAIGGRPADPGPVLEERRGSRRPRGR